MLVSTVTPLYNLAKFLPDAIGSLMDQEYRDLEIIIVNDGSTDDSGSVADSFARKDNRIRVIHQENRGLSGAMNRGFGEAKGEAMIILSPDDMLHPQAISDMVAAMQRTDADIVNTDMLVGGHHITTVALDLGKLKRTNCHGYAALFRRWVFEKTGGFKTTMNPSWEDYEFFLHAAKLGAKGHRVAKPHFVYRPNPNGRNAEAQGQDRLLRGKLEGYHQDVFGRGRGVVTFVVPLYDQERWVREAVESAMGQIYPHIEVIVVDDGSPGDSVAALDGLPVWLIRQENRGLSGARNSGLLAACDQLQSQYAVCLDADDGVSEDFVEATMAVMGEREYVYTDMKFFGDAWHDFQAKDFSADIWDRHLHACTFLFETAMWREVVAMRGYGYDEAMRIGYEDWEFALANVEAGWRGKRLSRELFNYRYHQNGSMRIRATKKNNELVQYIHRKHSKEAVMAGCKSCGSKATYTSKGATIVSEQPGGAIQVTYTGTKTGMIRKLGRRGQLYSYSAKHRTFYADAVDRHLFEHGPYKLQPITGPRPRQVVPVAQVHPQAPQQMMRMDRPAPTLPPATALQPQEGEPIGPQEVVQLKQAVSRVYTGDNLAHVEGLAKPQAERLVIAGVTTYNAIVDLSPVELSSIIGCSYSEAQAIISGAIVAMKKKGKKDDLTRIKGIGTSKADKLQAAGLATFADIAQASIAKIAEALGTTESKAEGVKNGAANLAS